MPDGPLDENGDVGRPLTDIHEDDAHLLLRLRQDGISRRQTGEHQLAHFDAGAGHALRQVLQRGSGAHHHVCLHLQTKTVHAQRIAHAFLPIHDVGTGDDVQQLLVLRQRDRAGRLQYTIHIVGSDSPVTAGHAHHALAVTRGDMRATDPDKRAFNLVARVLFGPFYRLGDSGGRLRHVDDHALPHTTRRYAPQAHNAGHSIVAYLTDQYLDLMTAHIYADN